MKELYHIDMEAEGRHSKRLSDLPPVDIGITMGCHGRGSCKIHYIRDIVLEDRVTEAGALFLYMLAKRNNAMQKEEQNGLNVAVGHEEKRIMKIDRLIKSFVRRGLSAYASRLYAP